MNTDEAVVCKLTWKPNTIGFAIDLVCTGLDLQEDGVLEFNNDDVPEDRQPLDKTTVGAVFRQLRIAGIIERTGNGRPSQRTECNGHWNSLWRLRSAPLARTFLARHGHAVAERPRQLELLVT